MATEDEVDRQAGELFNRHIRTNHKVDDIKALETLLPHDAAVLRQLGNRCVKESRKAMRAGRHMEGRRFDILGRQLHERAKLRSS